jgi:hypothetical protein
MSTTETARPATSTQPARHAAFDRPTATFPTADHLARLEHEEAAHRERLADIWADRTPTGLLPVVGPAFPRVSTHRKPTHGRVAPPHTAPTGTKGLRRQSRLSRHLRAALAAPALAAAILIPMQLFAAAGISSARQAALAARSGQTSSSAVLMSGQSTHSGQGAPYPMSGQMNAQPDWVTEDTGAAYDRTNSHASPLDLPRCTTSQDTPLPCLATISPDSRRAVVLEEDTSLTALIRR